MKNNIIFNRDLFSVSVIWDMTVVGLENTKMKDFSSVPYFYTK